ncbi:hypothetical protein [Thauera sp. SDU_THAU2]|uniref:hypothetical protein n=1 Tax=Thauera sp. SDU_THAU2 TaxID=3136633 RepID=UPI00311F078E
MEPKIAMAGLDFNAFEVHGYGDRVIHQIKADGKHIASLRTGLNQHKWTGRFFGFFFAFAWFFLASRSVRT